MKLARTTTAVAAGVLAAGTLVAVTPTADAAGAPAVHVRIRHHHVHMPRVLHPGARKILIRSSRQAAFQIVRKDPGYRDRQLVHDVNAGLNSNRPDVKALKRFERHVTLLGGVSSSRHHPGRMWLRLHRGGHYLAVDTNVRRTRVGQLFHFRVAGALVPGTLPQGRHLAAIHETTWAPRPKAIPQRGVLRFANRSTDNHFIALAKLLPGKTVADFKAWIEAAMNGQNVPPPIEENSGLDTGVLSPGHRFAFRYHLPRGHYILACFWPDAEMGGLPHAFMGMYRGLTVR